MTDRPTRIRKRAVQQQRKGNAGNAVKLNMLASEAKTLKEKPPAHDGAEG